MKQQALVAEQFGNTAAAYLTSAVHAGGADLEAVKAVVQRYKTPAVLDLGCGAGHISFAAAPFSASVTAYDLSEQMLAVVAESARQRNLGNIHVMQGPAEKLPFPDASFDVVVTRFSAHHWGDVPAALKEVHRVLHPAGVAIVIDIIASENPLHDTTLQAVELLRDASHVRDYRVSEWAGMFDAAGLSHQQIDAWRLKMVFGEWTARMRTPPDRVTAIRSLLDTAPEEARRYFSVENDHSFFIDAAFFEARKAGD
ncbi:class I SAM-dependent methyltransferase [Noviherbaspirillum galbum]|uniref:Class I SAM-dependent methyltransferase n=1 Tax=Noviherbaspirillum galbum TaxID=2709383 RepID=A0A6B3SNW1_9BURK|nr:class I SAM-dependent methyltransferase [Noviherbaspirillum galbum]NEX60975.1 class I SAM-dependent methyltransferase [Noviherbaspirillum galbum]